MASIIGESKFRSADGNGWSVADKVFGYLDESVNIYNKARAGVYDEDGNKYQVGEYQPIGVFGLPKPWGGIIIMGGVLVIGLVLIKAAK